MFSVKRQLRDYLKKQEYERSRDEEHAEETGLMSPSGRVVMTAVIMWVPSCTMQSLVTIRVPVFAWLPILTILCLCVSRNGCNFLFKLAAWLYTGSHSMFAETVHSLADTINQIILAYGIHKSTQVC